MQTSPEELEKLLLKKKPNTGPLPSVEKIPSEDFSLIPKNVGEVNNSCFIKLVTGGILAAGMGGVFGFFLGSLSQMTNPMASQPMDPAQRGKASVGSELKKSMRYTYLKGKSMARSMAVFGAVYTALECVTERVLGTKSIWTNALAGCGAGLAFGAKNGPTAACLSCVGFAAFGIVIDMFMF
ncbi:hypothetical protein BLSTO_02882 [Blastocystis sp. subtype 1]